MATLVKTKKTQSKWSKQSAKESNLNQLVIKEVEVDKDMDKGRFLQFEKELLIVLPRLKNITDELFVNAIRFRNFGSNTLGMCDYHTSTVLMNISQQGENTFLHEYGHALDEIFYLKKMGVDSSFSTQKDFAHIVEQYKQIYLQLNPYTKMRKGTIYYKINDPYEIFANAFRYYMVHDLIEKELDKNETIYFDSYVMLPIHSFVMAIQKNKVKSSEFIIYQLRKDIIKYFDYLFDKLNNNE